MKDAIKLLLVYMFLSMAALACVRSVGCGDEFGHVAGMLLTIAYLYQRNYIDSFRTLFTFSSAASLGRVCLMGVAFIVSVTLLIEWIPLPDWYEANYHEKLSTPWGVLMLTVLSPLFEELFFRKAITDAFLKSNTPQKAVLYSGLLFGFMHLNPAQVLPAIFIGTFLAWVYYRTNSILPTALIHIANNSLAVWIMQTHPDVENTWDWIGGPAYGVLLLLSVSLFLVLFKKFVKHS